MGSFATTVHLFFLCFASVFTSLISVGDFKHARSIPTAADIHSTTRKKISITAAKGYQSWRNKSQVHTYCSCIHAKLVGALYHPPDKSEVYYLQGCHAGTFSKYKIRKPNVKNTTLHCIISTGWCNINDNTECCQFVHQNRENVQKYPFIVFQSEVLLFRCAPEKGRP